MSCESTYRPHSYKQAEPLTRGLIFVHKVSICLEASRYNMSKVLNPKKTTIHRETCTPLFTVAQLPIGKAGTTKFPPTAKA